MMQKRTHKQISAFYYTETGVSRIKLRVNVFFTPKRGVALHTILFVETKLLRNIIF